MEQCASKLIASAGGDPKVLQRMIFLLGMDDPLLIRASQNLNSQELLGEKLALAKMLAMGLTTLIKLAPQVLSQQLKDNFEWKHALLSSLTARIALYDQLQTILEETPDAQVVRFWEETTQIQRYWALVRFYCPIVRLYAEKVPQVFEHCSKPIFEFLLGQLRVCDEVLSFEITSTLETLMNKTDFVGFFLKYFLDTCQMIIMEPFEDEEQLLHPDIVLAKSNLFHSNVAMILHGALQYAAKNDEPRFITMAKTYFGMQHFPHLITAAFRASACRGYLPFIYGLFSVHTSLLQRSHFGAIDPYVERTCKILRHAASNPSTFGTTRFGVFQLVPAFIRFEQLSINSSLVQCDIGMLMLDLMCVAYPFANAIHDIVLECFQEIFLKDRRNKTSSIFQMMLVGEFCPGQMLTLVDSLVSRMHLKQFGCENSVGYMDHARRLFMIFDECTRVRELVKTNPNLVPKWKTIRTDVKSYNSMLEKENQKTQKLLLTAVKLSGGNADLGNSELGDDYAVMNQLRQLGSKEEIVHDNSVVQFKRRLLSHSM